MQIIDHILADLKLRYAECHAIDIAVAHTENETRLVGSFQARRDGVVRRHVYTLGPTGGDDTALRPALARALESFRLEIDRATRKPRPGA